MVLGLNAQIYKSTSFVLNNIFFPKIDLTFEADLYILITIIGT